MKPILYNSTTKDFSNNGIGVLSDAAFCEVTEERNGILELVLDYPINGIHFSEIKQRSIITAKPNPTADAQPFRVYRVTKPLNGMVTVFAQHISYDLSGIAVTPFSAGSAAAALQALKTNSVVENPFEFWTDLGTVAEMNVKTPASVRAMLGGVQGSVLDTYGGEYEWDGFTVKLYNERGRNRGVSIRYGKNLTDLEQEENCANVYTAVMPFWADSEGNSTMLTEKIVEVEGNFDFVRVLTLDLSNEFDAQPLQDELRDRAQKYIDDNNIGVPKISLRVSFVPLEQTEEYKNIALLERVNLCDTVNVEFEKLGVSATAKVVKTVYNVLLNRYESVELGDARSNIADTLVKQEQAIKEAPKKAMSMVAQAAENATQLITGNRGGYVVIHSSTGASEPDEILIMDTPSIETATKVWRWNNSGLGYSESGYPGPYISAWTIDGVFNADFITAGTISANLIKSGLLTSLNQMTTFDMDSGEFTIGQEKGVVCKIDRYGVLFYGVNSETGEKNEYIKLTTEEQTTSGLTLIKGQVFSEYIEAENLKAKLAEVQQIKVANENTSAEIYNAATGGVIKVNNAEGEEKAALWATSDGSARFVMKNADGKEVVLLAYTDNLGGVLETKDGNGTAVSQLRNKSGCGGQLELRNENGSPTFSLSNRSGGGAECWIGEGSGAYKLFDYYSGKRRIFVDEANFNGKTNGLINSIFSNIDFADGSSLNFDGNGYSAIIISGWPGPEDSSSKISITVPISAIRVGNSSNYSSGAIWQIADDNYSFGFNLYRNSSNQVYMASKFGSGHITEIYGIR